MEIFEANDPTPVEEEEKDDYAMRQNNINDDVNYGDEDKVDGSQ